MPRTKSLVPTLIRLFPALASASILSGCGGGHGNGTVGGGGGPGSGVSFEQRKAVFDAIDRQEAKITGVDGAIDPQQLLAFLKTRPELLDSGVTLDGSVWGQFKDGPMMVIALNDVTPDTGAAPAKSAISRAAPPASPRKHVPASGSSPARTRSRSVSGAGLPEELPDDRSCRFINAFGNAFSAPDELRVFLKTVFSEAGYYFNSDQTRPEPGGGTVEDLKVVSGDGVFVFVTHGGLGQTRQSGGAPVPALWTATPISKGGDLKAWLDGELGTLSSSQRVCYMQAVQDIIKQGNPPLYSRPWHYGITPASAKRYWNFAKYSLVYIGAPSSADTGFQDAVFNPASTTKGTAANVYAAWTGPANVKDLAGTGFWLFDRMLGANAAALSQGYLANMDPPQRPFDWRSLGNEITKEATPWGSFYGASNVTARSGGKPVTWSSKLNIYKNELDLYKSDLGSLVPSIESVGSSSELKPDEMQLSGMFGSHLRGATNALVSLQSPGPKPTRDDLRIVDWTRSNTIVCKVPSHGGYLLVESGDQDSNKVTVMNWILDYHYTQTYPGGANVKADFFANVIGFVQGMRPRDSPGTTPPPLTLGPIFVLPNSQVTWKASGSMPYHYSNDVGTATFSGHGTVPISYQVSGPTSFRASGQGGSANGTFKLAINTELIGQGAIRVNNHSTVSKMPDYQTNIDLNIGAPAAMLVLDRNLNASAAPSSVKANGVTVRWTLDPAPSYPPLDPRLAR